MLTHVEYTKTVETLKGKKNVKGEANNGKTKLMHCIFLS